MGAAPSNAWHREAPRTPSLECPHLGFVGKPPALRVHRISTPSLRGSFMTGAGTKPCLSGLSSGW
jgi:hypothetical protein